MRALLFVIAFLVAIALNAPLERLLLPTLRASVEPSGATLELKDLRFALPAGLRARGVRLESPDAVIHIDSIYIGLTRRFDAEACGGRITGRLSGSSVNAELAGVDLTKCVRVGKLELAAALDGSLSVSDLGAIDPNNLEHLSASLNVASEGGIFRGTIPNAGQGGTDLPLGEWEFSNLALRAKLGDGEVDVEEGHAEISGVEWQLLGVRLPTSNAKSGLRIDFRARPVEDGSHSRALLSLMPRASEDGNGWRNYRVNGSFAAPRMIGIE